MVYMNTNTYYNKNIKKLYYENFINYELDDMLSFYDNIPYTDLSYLNVYSIDPEGCEDVDDAFSYEYNSKNKEQYIYIHIADPTKYIDINSQNFDKIIFNAFTRYPSNNNPLHLMPKNILEKSSLHENKEGCKKDAITIKLVFDNKNNLLDNKTKILFTKLKVNKDYKFAYNNVPIENKEIKSCLNLSNHILKDLIYNNTSIEIKYRNKNPYFYTTSLNELKYKKMIAKFAIYSNNFVAYYLKNKLDSNHIIFRTCPVFKDNNILQDKSISFQNFLSFIFQNNVSAEYNNKHSNHDILNLSEYLHMTSPIRRSVDCIIHIILKHVYLNINIPFSENDIENFINQSNIVNKKLKKIQFSDNKFRYLQIMSLCLNNFNTNESYKINFEISSTKYFKDKLNNNCVYINIFIYKIDNYDCYLSYTLKKSNITDETKDNINNNLCNKEHICNIYKSYPCNYYDEGCLPDLDNYIFNKC